MDKKPVTVSGILIRIGIVLCLFQLPLASLFDPIGYFDEVLAVLMALACIVKIKDRPITKDIALILIMLFFN